MVLLRRCTKKSWAKFNIKFAQSQMQSKGKVDDFDVIALRVSSAVKKKRWSVKLTRKRKSNINKLPLTICYINHFSMFRITLWHFFLTRIASWQPIMYTSHQKKLHCSHIFFCPFLKCAWCARIMTNFIVIIFWRFISSYFLLFVLRKI